MSNFMKAGFIVGFIIFVIILSPLIAISSLNEISEQARFGWNIPHNFWTYLSVYGLVLVFKSSTGKNN